MKSKKWKYYLGFLFLVVISVWMAVFALSDNNLHLVTCDVGQGDASLIYYGKIQVLIDGGPDTSVINCLNKYIPYWDRKIEVVILTHPQADHYTGIIEVFRRYKVDYFLANALDSGNQTYEVLKNVVRGSSAKVVNPTTGMVVRVGMIYLDILNPSQQFLEKNGAEKISESNTGFLGVYSSSIDPNGFSIVAVLHYNNFDALFTGDIDNQTSEELAKVIEENYKYPLEYIKIPHHGSKNGITKSLLDATRPEVALISVGKRNSYGHPHKEILDMLNEYNLKVYRTDELGNIEIESDGVKWWKI